MNTKAVNRLRNDGMSLPVARKVVEHLEATDPENPILSRGTIYAGSRKYFDLSEAMHKLRESEELREVRRTL